MIGQFKLTRMTVIWRLLHENASREKRRVLSHLWLSHMKSTPHGEVQGRA